MHLTRWILLLLSKSIIGERVRDYNNNNKRKELYQIWVIHVGTTHHTIVFGSCTGGPNWSTRSIADLKLGPTSSLGSAIIRQKLQYIGGAVECDTSPANYDFVFGSSQILDIRIFIFYIINLLHTYYLIWYLLETYCFVKILLWLPFMGFNEQHGTCQKYHCLGDLVT